MTLAQQIETLRESARSHPGREIWLPVEGYEGAYEISSMGRVVRVGRRVLKPAMRGGCAAVHLSINNRDRMHSVARLVLIAFVGHPRADEQACHFPDRDPLNCRLSNLRWGTATDNARDRTKHGTYADRRGEKHPLAKLSVAKVLEARRLRADGWTQASIAARLDVTQSAISRALNGKRWTHLTA